jgi:hypothetical protein
MGRQGYDQQYCRWEEGGEVRGGSYWLMGQGYHQQVLQVGGGGGRLEGGLTG